LFALRIPFACLRLTTYIDLWVAACWPFVRGSFPKPVVPSTGFLIVVGHELLVFLEILPATRSSLRGDAPFSRRSSDFQPSLCFFSSPLSSPCPLASVYNFVPQPIPANPSTDPQPAPPPLGLLITLCARRGAVNFFTPLSFLRSQFSVTSFVWAGCPRPRSNSPRCPPPQQQP